ncbi:hypothetical protein [Leptospira wolffii]|nr:hypothetical protein [Leptospira wolffii]
MNVATCFLEEWARIRACVASSFSIHSNEEENITKLTWRKMSRM